MSVRPPATVIILRRFLASTVLIFQTQCHMDVVLHAVGVHATQQVIFPFVFSCSIHSSYDASIGFGHDVGEVQSLEDS